MSSQVSTTFPRDNEKVSKSEMRTQFQTIKTEIEALQRETTLPWRIVLSDFETL